MIALAHGCGQESDDCELQIEVHGGGHSTGQVLKQRQLPNRVNRVNNDLHPLAPLLERFDHA